MKLYRATRERRYLELSLRLTDNRGKAPFYFDTEAERRGDSGYFGGHFGAVVRSDKPPRREYNQSHAPVREQDTAVGHSVRAMYQYTAMADLALELGDAGLREACEKPLGRPRRHQALRHRRHRLRPVHRGLRPGLRPARPHRLRRDLRRDRPGLLGPPHDAPDRRGQIRRRARTRPLQRRALGRLRRRHALLLRQPARQRRHRRTQRLVRLRLLPAQPRPAPDLPRALRLRRRHRGPLGEPLRHRPGPLRPRRPARHRDPGERLPVGRHDRLHASPKPKRPFP